MLIELKLIKIILQLFTIKYIEIYLKIKKHWIIKITRIKVDYENTIVFFYKFSRNRSKICNFIFK